MSDDTLTALSRYLRPSSNQNPLEKMLTPVEERPAAEYERDHSPLSDEGEQDVIVPTSSDKLDSAIFSRTLSSGLSYHTTTWLVGEMDLDRGSNRDNSSILSSGYGTPPRPILNSTNSVDIAEISQAENLEDLAKALENHEEKGSSQGSDDSSAFSDSAHYNQRSGFNNVASPQGSGSFSFSSAEGTPVRTMSETRKKRHTEPTRGRKKHLVGSVSDSTTLRNPHARWSPHSSTRSSMSGVTVSSQSSLGEEGTGSDASDKRAKLKKMYAKYERYERRERSQSLDVTQERKREVVDMVSSDNEPTQRLTQDSNGTLTDGNLESMTETLTEVELSSLHSVTSTDSFYQNMNGQSSTAGKSDISPNPDKTRDDGEEESDRKNGVLDLMHVIPKTPERSIDGASSPVSKSVEDDASPSDGSKPSSYTLVFTSRDSVLTDSPDTDSLNEDYVNSKTSLTGIQQASKLEDDQKNAPSSILERESRATSEESESSVGSPAHVELIIEDGKPARLYKHTSSPPIVISHGGALDFILDSTRASDNDDGDDENSIHEFERSGASATPTAPRSLEGPSFSRYARVPIRSTESKPHIRLHDSPLCDTGSNLRQRACSLNDLDEPCSDEEGEDGAKSERRISATECEKSLTPTVPRSTRSSNSGGRASEVRRLSQSFSAMNLLASSCEGDVLLKAQDKRFGGSLRLEKKPKKGKGFVSRLKPALRVFKITPNSSVDSKKEHRKVSQIERAYLPDEEGRDYGDHLVPRPYEEMRRMRMMSPEVMPVEDAPPTNLIRRSRSTDDILDHSADDLTDISTHSTEVGPIFVIPEPAKPKRRFLGFQSKKFSTKESSKKRDRERSRSPVVLVGVQSRSRRVSIEPIMTPTSSANGNGPFDDNSQQKSPKSKRRRLPHFV